MLLQRRLLKAVLAAIVLFAISATAPAAGDSMSFWQATFNSLEAFPPSFVSTATGEQLWQCGYRGAVLAVRCWPAEGPVLVIAAGFPRDVAPPDDGMTWAVLPPQPWTPLGLPDTDAYFVRDRALWMAQIIRAAEGYVHRRVSCVLLAEGFDAPAALAVAACFRDNVAGVVLVNPKPWRHFAGDRVAVEGAAARHLRTLCKAHPSWKRPLQQGLSNYDIAALAPHVRCPVVVLTSLRRPPQWLMYAAAEWGWELIHSARRSPSIAELCRAGMFNLLWAEALDRLQAGPVCGQLAQVPR